MTRTLTSSQPSSKNRPGNSARSARSAANKAAHAELLAKVRADEKAKKAAAPKLAKPEAHPLKLKGGKEWDREKVFGHICERIASSTDSLTAILNAGYEGYVLPGYGLVQYWISSDPACEAAYLKAKEAQADFMGDEMIGIAEDGRNDYMERFDKDGTSLGFVLNGEHVQRSRLRIDTRKWLMAKLKPRRYGEKIEAPAESPHDAAEAVRQALAEIEQATAGTGK